MRVQVGTRHSLSPREECLLDESGRLRRLTKETGTLDLLPQRVWDYQTGDLSQWNAQDLPPNRTGSVEIVTHPRRSNRLRKTAKYTIEPDDIEKFGNPLAQRTQVTATALETGWPREGDEQWFAWSTYFPADFEMGQDCLYFTYTEWHHTAQIGNPSVAFFLKRDEPTGLLLTVRSGTSWAPPTSTVTYDLNQPVIRETWMDHEVYFKWSTGSAGRIGVWINGVERLSPTISIPNMYDGVAVFPYDQYGQMSTYLEQGAYRGKCERFHTVYHSGTRRGNTRESVALPL